MPTETDKWRRGSAPARVTSVYDLKLLSERVILNQDHTVASNWLPFDSSWIQGVRQEVEDVTTGQIRRRGVAGHKGSFENAEQ